MVFQSSKSVNLSYTVEVGLKKNLLHRIRVINTINNARYGSAFDL